jgi:hypothetical protein
MDNRVRRHTRRNVSLGPVTVTINVSDLFSRRRGPICHCANCRIVRGSYTASNMIIAESKVQVKDQDSTLAVFLDTPTRSGVPFQRWFRNRCGK